MYTYIHETLCASHVKKREKHPLRSVAISKVAG